MTFASWSIRNPIPSILLFVLLSIAGLRAFSQLAIQDLPDMTLPSVNVVASLPGAAPAQLETEVARPIEDALAAVDGLRHVTTSINDGTVQIEASFELDKPLSDALIQAKDAIDSIRSDLPADMLQPTVQAVTFGTAPVLVYAVQSSRMDELELSWFVDDALGKAIRAVPGVGKVERLGGVTREVRVTVDPTRMAALGVSAADVSRALRQVQQQSSGGRGQLGGQEQSIRTVALVAQATDLATLPIVLADGRHVRLDQLARIEDGAAERTQAAFLDGKPVVGFQVYRARGADETKVAKGVYKVLSQQRGKTPGLDLRLVGGSVDYTVEQYHGSMSMLYEGAILAVIVVWLFLRDWRATLIVATALPLSILPTFAAMAVFGYSLNTLTLLALAVVIGILVDDAIVEVENIERHRRMGKPVREATEEAVSEIALPVIATTLSLVAVFLPTAMMPGFAGLIFKPFGWTAVIAVLASLLVARLLTPMLAAHFLKDTVAPEPEDGRWMRRYLSAADWCLSHPKVTAAATVVFLAGSLALTPLIPTGFLPPDDRSMTEVSVELPPGSALDATTAVTEEVREVLVGLPGVRGVFAAIGQAGGGGAGADGVPEVRRATLTVSLAPRDDRPAKTRIEAMIGDSLRMIPGARFAVGEGGASRLDLILASDDPHALKTAVQRLEREMRTIPGLSNINSTASLEQQEIVIRPDPWRAAERGVTTEAVGEAVRIGTSGDFDAQVARLNLDNRQLFIRTRIADAARHAQADHHGPAHARNCAAGGGCGIGRHPGR
ncbi:MAG TPA: efflux RND transporter permease subunit, partial [Caulobacter sp.]|nr:efflux RND transporter permease subunit [Caulobacter sp.]